MSIAAGSVCGRLARLRRKNELIDLLQVNDGRQFKLSDYDDKVIMVDFWGDW